MSFADLLKEKIEKQIESWSADLDAAEAKARAREVKAESAKADAELARIATESLEQIDTPDELPLLRNFKDPYAPGAWTACFDRVIVEGRRLPIADTGWIVLVEEQIAE